jgi:hypothetical protein
MRQRIIRATHRLMGAISSHHVSLAAGLAVAALLAFTFQDEPATGELNPGDDSARLAASRLLKGFPSGSSPVVQTEQPVVVFYLVSGEAQRDHAIQREEGDPLAVLFGSLGRTRSVIVLLAGTAAEELKARDLIDDAMQAANFSYERPAPKFEIHDLR